MHKRWPTSEPITSQKQLDKFNNLSLVGVVFYGDKKAEEGYKNFTKAIPHFSHSHQRFGHVFDWELKKKFATKLPCIEVKSHFHKVVPTGLLCQNLNLDSIKSLLEGFLPEPHEEYHHELSKRWFSGGTRSAMVYFHKGLASDTEKYVHRVFHQFIDHHSFGARIAESNINRVKLVHKETRLSASRNLQHRP